MHTEVLDSCKQSCSNFDSNSRTIVASQRFSAQYNLDFFFSCYFCYLFESIPLLSAKKTSGDCGQDSMNGDSINNNSNCCAGGPATRVRWNPTKEQLRILENVYNGGNKSPRTEQIQHITAELRRHGNVAGINVFYWFKNRKARERRRAKSASVSSSSSSSSQSPLQFHGDSSSRVRAIADANYYNDVSLSSSSGEYWVMETPSSSSSTAAEVADNNSSSVTQTLQLFPPPTL